MTLPGIALSINKKGWLTGLKEVALVDLDGVPDSTFTLRIGEELL
jgi:hypothetical protein